MSALKEATMYRRHIVTDCTFTGLVSHDGQESDGIFIFLDRQILYILRENEGGNYQFIGERYMHGMMDGEAMKFFDENQEKPDRVRIGICPIILE